MEFEDLPVERYREIVVFLWEMIHHYVNVSPKNLGLILELFERSMEMTYEAANLEPDVRVAEYLDKIVNEIMPEVKQHFEILTRMVLHNISSPYDELVNSTSLVPVARPANSEAPADKYQNARKDTIASCKIYPNDGGLDTVIGLIEAKKIIEEAVIFPSKFPRLFMNGRTPWKHLLLYGPPGTGKTKLAHAAAAEIQAAIYCITSADLLSVWMGESEKMIRELFQTINSGTEKVVVFMDEIDGMCGQRRSGEDTSTRRFKNELLSRMNTLSATVFLIAATNCPWDIDPAFIRRFQRRVYIPLPDRESRLNIIKAHTGELKMSLTDDDWESIAGLTSGYSGSDLAALTQSALMEPVREISSATHWIIQGSMWTPVSSHHPRAIRATAELILPYKIVPRDVNKVDFEKAITSTQKSISEEDIKRYIDFQQKYK